MGALHVIDHPLIQHKLGIMRERSTNSMVFRILLNEISMLMAYEATSGLELEDVGIETPVGHTTARRLKDHAFAIVPILRAGLGMVDGLMAIMPQAKVGHLGLCRNEETHKPEVYYIKLPDDIAQRKVLIVDPMLATGGSAVHAISILKEHGCTHIRLMCLISAPEGVRAVREAHPDVDIYVAAVDERLNENAYIVPGLGDAGDRIFGTK